MRVEPRKGIIIPKPVLALACYDARKMNWEHLTETVIRMDGAVRRIGVEPPWKGRSDASARRVSVRCSQFMLLQVNGPIVKISQFISSVYCHS